MLWVAGVRTFLTTRGLSIPVLLDKEGEVAEKYNIHAIPQTIVIGKNGDVKKVFIGATSDTPEQIRREIELAKGGQEASAK